jgi:hypothetical protein
VNDDALEMRHPDLVANLDAATSFDHKRNVADPAGDEHSLLFPSFFCSGTLPDRPLGVWHPQKVAKTDHF